MKYRRLGQTDIEVSELAIGCQSFAGGVFRPIDSNQALRVMRRAFEGGVNLFDCSESYGQLKAEELVREAFSKDRDRIVIATKIGDRYPKGLTTLLRARWLASPFRNLLKPARYTIHRLMSAGTVFDYSRQHLIDSLERRLRVLGTDYVDICQINVPSADVLKRGDFIETLHELRAQGKARCFGVYCLGIEEALLALRHPELVCVQIPMNLLDQAPMREFLPEAKARGVGVIAKRALAHGILTDSAPFKAEVLARSNERLSQGIDLAQRFRFLAIEKRTMAQSAFKFVLSFPEVSSVMAGIVSESEVEENLGIFDAPDLTEAERARAMSVSRETFSEY